eukprot:316167-Pyramimonas_sp.AAC.1
MQRPPHTKKTEYELDTSNVKRKQPSGAHWCHEILGATLDSEDKRQKPVKLPDQPKEKQY